jgi:intracellular sulfur oxidation DsrE/DsrF family protein
MTARHFIRSPLGVIALAFASLLAGMDAEAQINSDTPIKRVAQTKITKTAPTVMRKLAIQVDQNDKDVMELALNNAKNVLEHYKAKGEDVDIEIVTYGPGLHMLRADTSPVKERIGPLSFENQSIKFIACGNTQANQSKAEG